MFPAFFSPPRLLLASAAGQSLLPVAAYMRVPLLSAQELSQPERLKIKLISIWIFELFNPPRIRRGSNVSKFSHRLTWLAQNKFVASIWFLSSVTTANTVRRPPCLHSLPENYRPASPLNIWHLARLLGKDIKFSLAS